MARLLPDELQATGQTLVQGATFGLGSALGAAIGGVLYGAAGPTVFFAIAGGMAVAGGIGAWFVLAGSVGAASNEVPATPPAEGAAEGRAVPRLARLVPDPAMSSHEADERHA